MRPDQLESAFGMNADRTGIGGIADHGDHLPVAARLAFSDQPLQQLQTNAAAVDRGLEIDRVFHREAVGRPRPVRAGVGIADHLAFQHCCEIRKAAVHQRAKPPRHLSKVWRDQFEGRGAVADRVFVDPGDGGEVGLGGGPDFKGGHGGETIFNGRKRKAPAARPGLSVCPFQSAISRAGRAAAAAA